MKSIISVVCCYLRLTYIKKAILLKKFFLAISIFFIITSSPYFKAKYNTILCTINAIIDAIITKPTPVIKFTESEDKL